MKAELMQSHKVFSSFAAKESSLVFLNGVFQPELSRFQRLPAGVSLETRDGFTLRIPDKMVIEDIMHVVLVSDDSAEARQEFAVKVFAGISSRMNLVVHKAGDGVFNPKKIVTELRLAEGACVDYFQLEDSGVRGEFEGENHFYLKKHAVLDYLVFAAAEGVSMNRTIVEFEGEHGFFSAKGLSMLHGKSRAEHALTVNHRAPACISRQYYKTVLAGSSKAAFDSLVHVHAGASKSDSHQLNRNLLL